MSIINSDIRLTEPRIRDQVRPPAVAGQFYPRSATELRAMLARLLAAAPGGGGIPKALIVPHAGYVYSGPVAATAYASLAAARDRIRRVILLGPAHRVAFRGLALPAASHFETPLGQVPVDAEVAARLLRLPGVSVLDEAHEREHSLEVHLPFLQHLLAGFTLVPLVVGDADAGTVARVLEASWGGEETLIVISSDLSHYHDYETARRRDAESSRAIEQLEFERLGPYEACGCRPLRGLLLLARRRGLKVRCVDLRNSGDTAGGRDRVVGYGAWIVTEAAADTKDGAILLGIARASIEHGLDGKPLSLNIEDYPAGLRAPGAAFVTLTLDGALRGCMGTTEAREPLVRCVAESAYKAAFRDPRFAPLTRDEHARTSVSVSVLSPAEPVTFANEAELEALLRPGVDGLIIEAGSRRATFLPSVWESLPSPAAFLKALKRKAGIPAATAPERAWRYTAEYYKED